MPDVHTAPTALYATQVIVPSQYPPVHAPPMLAPMQDCPTVAHGWHVPEVQAYPHPQGLAVQLPPLPEIATQCGPVASYEKHWYPRAHSPSW